jgi:hypothetical protein
VNDSDQVDEEDDGLNVHQGYDGEYMGRDGAEYEQEMRFMIIISMI